MNCSFCGLSEPHDHPEITVRAVGVSIEKDENRPPMNWTAVKTGLCFLCEMERQLDNHAVCADCAWLCGCYTCLECDQELRLGEGEIVDGQPFGRQPFCVSCAQELRQSVLVTEPQESK